MLRDWWPLAVVIAATWQAWGWYLHRIALVPEEGAALVLSVGFVLALAWRDRSSFEASGGKRRSAVTSPGSPDLLVPAGLLAAYAVGFAVGVPPIGRAGLAMCAAMACLYGALLGRRAPVALHALVALSLPVLPSLQMTFGFALRLASAAMTVVMLRAQGLAVEREGTFLVWRGEMVQFDAPCSGVNMVWAGVLIALMGSVALRLPIGRAAVGVMAGAGIAVLGNVLRASSLFYVEAGLVTGLPPMAHEGMGMVAFAMCAAGIALVLRALETAGGGRA
jgi:exosortase/archaeosortase family protein